MERLLDAAEDLLGDNCFEDIHVSEIALRAETSVAGFYRRFTDKDALLHALHERLCEEAFATADDALASERWEGAGIAEILSGLISFVIEALQQHETLDRAIYQRALADEQMRERSSRLTRHVVLGISELLLERREEIHHPKPQMAVSFALVQAMALLVQHYTVAIREIEPVLMSDEQVALEVTSSCLAYLGVGDPNTLFEELKG
jgi:AcrR family transcriptional regulator